MKMAYLVNKNNKQLYNQWLIWHAGKKPQDAEAQERFHY